MADKSPAIDEWRRLYEVAIRVKELAPWDWMMETDLFGVKDPETGEVGFVSVMGSGGEYYSIALYIGSKGLYGFWRLQNERADVIPERVMEIPQLQASFEDREMLKKDDRDKIKKLGLKFRGRKA